MRAERQDTLKTILLLLVVACFTVLSPVAMSEDKRKPVRIGELWFADGERLTPYKAAFRQGLAELGYVEGESAIFVTHYASGDPARISPLLAELIAAKVDIMFVAPRAAKDSVRANKTIPMVTAGLSDAVAEGLAHSLARPGGNLTGTSWLSPESSNKRLELLMETMPKLKRVALLFDAGDGTAVVEVRGAIAAAERVRIETREFRVQASPDFDTAFKAIETYRPDAIMLTASALMLTNVERIIAFARANKLPVVSEFRDYAQAGVLLTYGSDAIAGFKRAAYFVDRILKGAKPGDLPIEQPTKFELVINQRTAEALGIKFPESILFRADEVIK